MISGFILSLYMLYNKSIFMYSLTSVQWWQWYPSSFWSYDENVADEPFDDLGIVDLFDPKVSSDTVDSSDDDIDSNSKINSYKLGNHGIDRLRWRDAARCGYGSAYGNCSKKTQQMEKRSWITIEDDDFFVNDNIMASVSWQLLVKYYLQDATVQ